MIPPLMLSDKETATILTLLTFLKTSSVAPEESEFDHPEGSLTDEEVDTLAARLEAHRNAIAADVQRLGLLLSSADDGAAESAEPVTYMVRVRACMGVDYRVIARSCDDAEREGVRAAKGDDWAIRLSDNGGSMDSYTVTDCYPEHEG